MPTLSISRETVKRKICLEAVEDYLGGEWNEEYADTGREPIYFTLSPEIVISS